MHECFVCLFFFFGRVVFSLYTWVEIFFVVVFP